MMKVGDKSLLLCTRCNRNTEHVALHVDHRDETQSDESGAWDLNHTLTRAFVECVVCSWPKIRIHVWTLPIESESELSIPAEPARATPDWSRRLPYDVKHVLAEVNHAFTEGQYWLVAMGCRALIDMFALERIGDTGGFAAKLKQLEAQRYLSEKERLLITQAVEAGHGATHRREGPTRRECLAVIEITEHLIQKLALDAHAETLNASAAAKAKLKKS